MNDDHFNKWTSEKSRVAFTNRILVGLTACLQSPNPVLANRERLCEELLLCAHYGVLLVPAAPETDSAGLRGQLGVTGELRNHLQDALRLSDEVKDRAGNMGMEGAKNPLYEWEKQHERKFPWRDCGHNGSDE